MGRVEGKVAFVTGAARGQGRSHAVRLAQEGADIIAVDISAQVESVPYPLATADDLAETVEAVEALDRRIVAAEADVRDYDALKAGARRGRRRAGRLDIVSRQRRHRLLQPGGRDARADLAGHDRHQPDRRLAHVQGRDPAPISDGGSIVLTSSTAGLAGIRQHQPLHRGQARRRRA